MKKKGIRDAIITITLPLLGILAIWLAVSNTTEAEKTTYSDVLSDFDNGKVTSFKINEASGMLEYTLEGDEGEYQNEYKVANTLYFWNDVNEGIRAHNIENKANPDAQIEYEIAASSTGTWFMSLIPTFLMFGIIIFFFFFLMRKMTSSMGNDKTMSFGKAKFKRDENNKTTLADVAGIDEEKEELNELIKFLKDPSQFNELGARMPKGILLVGPPGTGKTLLARAVAGEAGVPFYTISGSDFVEMYVGVGAARVRDLFATAKKTSPCIIFIDEIDAVGRQRGSGVGGGHDEREQTLNQLLVELDGFGVNEGIIVVAATNRPDVLDKALLRPGRFDRQVTVNYPDVKEREQILTLHSKSKPLGPDISLKTVAQTTAGFTGADLENLLNEAALLAARGGKKAITQEDIEEASIKVIMGAEKKSRVIRDKDKMITAYHEAGHAIVSFCLPTQDPVHQISIIPRGMAGGYTMYRPSEDQGHMSKNFMLETICSLLGGRAAESVTQDDIFAGASDDIRRATEIARNMVTRYGMSERLGPILYGTSNNEVFIGRDLNHTVNYSEKIAALIDDEIETTVRDQFEKAVSILKENVSKLHDLAKILFTEEKVDGVRFTNFMNGIIETTTEKSVDPSIDTTTQPLDSEKSVEPSADPNAKKVDTESTTEKSVEPSADPNAKKVDAESTTEKSVETSTNPTTQPLDTEPKLSTEQNSESNKEDV